MKRCTIREVLAVLCVAHFATSVTPARELNHCPDLTAADVMKNPTYMDFPKIPDSFEAHIEENSLPNKQTYVFRVYFDGINRRASTAYVLKDAKTDVHIYDYNKTEYYKVHDDCVGTPYTIDPTNSQFHQYSIIPSKYGMSSSHHYLGVPDTALKKYVGKKVIRGITVHHWTTCLNVLNSPVFNYSVNVDFYFSIKRWKNPDIPGNLKLVSVRGLQQQLNHPIPNRYDRDYVYTFFRGYITDTRVFEIPAGYVCNRDDKRPPPPLEKAFYAAYQFIDYINKTMDHGRMYVDSINRLKRLDTKFTSYENIKGQRYYNNFHDTCIMDSNTGVIYNINKVTQECSILPLTYWNQRNDQPKYGMFVPTVFTLMGVHGNIRSKLKYQGQRIVDGITCEVFAVNLEGVIIEHLFTAPTWKYTSSQPDSMFKYHVIYQINRFVKHKLTHKMKVSDVSSLTNIEEPWFNMPLCVGQNKIPVEIQIKLSKYPITLSLLQAIRQKIMHVAKIPLIRLQNEQLRHHTDDTLFYSFSLIEKLNNTKKIQRRIPEELNTISALAALTDCITRRQFQFSYLSRSLIWKNTGTALTIRIITDLPRPDDVTIPSIPHSERKVAGADEKVYYGPGAMAGLAFAMIIVGCLLTVALGYGYLKYRGQTLDSSYVMTLSKIDTKTDAGVM